MKTAVVIGSTGLIGSLLLEKLAQDGSYGQILAILRRKPAELAVLNNPRVRGLVFDFADWSQLDLQVRSFAGTSSLHFFCCLGTTIGQAGSQAAFRKVDLDHVIRFAQLAQSCRAEKLLVISALGANPQSKVFYNRVKGEMEAGVSGAFQGTLHFLRPSLLLGERTQFRFGERLAVLAAPLYAPLLNGSWRKYRPIQAGRVAETLLRLATGKISAEKILENEEMLPRG